MRVCRKGLLLSALCVAVVAGSSFAAGKKAAVRSAKAAATAWLGLVDKGQYEKSWGTAAELFKRAVSKSDWNKAMRAGRAPLGAVVSRKLKTAKYATSLPGAPDGEYVVIQFSSSFTKKKEAIETITPMLDGKAWRVSGYFIK